jgi:hypothetical protein
MAKSYANRVWMTTATSGTGTITLGSALAGYLTPAEAGVPNADTVTYCIIDGDDFELGTGTYTTSGTTLSRDTVTVSKIGGTAGTSKINLSGTAEVFLTTDANDVAYVDRENTFSTNQVISGRLGVGGSNDGTYGELLVSGTGYKAIALQSTDPGGVIAVLAANSTNEVRFGPPSAFPFWIMTANLARLTVAGSGEIAIGTGVDTFSGYPLRVGLVDAGASAGPVFDLFRDSSSPAASDVIGQVKFSGRDSAANAQDYADIQCVITSPTSTSESADIVFQAAAAGALAERARISSAGDLTLTGNAIYYQAEQAEVGTTYTLALADANKMVTLANGSAITLTVPTNASIPFPIGTRIDISQFGAGQVSVTSSATIRSEGGKLKLRGQYSAATLWKKATDEWLLAGDIVA